MKNSIIQSFLWLCFVGFSISNGHAQCANFPKPIITNVLDSNLFFTTNVEKKIITITNLPAGASSSIDNTFTLGKTVYANLDPKINLNVRMRLNGCESQTEVLVFPYRYHFTYMPGCYRIVNKATGKVLEIEGNSQVSGARIRQANPTGTVNQAWQQVYKSFIAYSFISRSSYHEIDAPNCTDGTPIRQSAFDQSFSSTWSLNGEGGDYFSFRNCGKALKAETNSDTVRIATTDLNALSDNFLWKVEKMPCPSSVCSEPSLSAGIDTVCVGSTINLKVTGASAKATSLWTSLGGLAPDITASVSDSVVKGLNAGASAIYATVYDGACITTLYKGVAVVNNCSFDPAKCYRIVNKVSGKSLEIKDASTAEGAVIYQWATVTGKANQLWQVKKLADGRYSFVSKSSGKLIDAPDCTEGGIIKQYASDGTDSQKWRFDLQTDGSYKLYNTSCQKYLRLESGSSADGASVGIKNDFGTDAFKWLIQEAACPANTATASIKDVFVYADNNNDTHYNQGDSPISGITVTLTNTSNQIVATTTSGTNGSYSFLNLAAGNYTLTFPATLADGKTITTRNPISVTLTAGQVFTSASAGYFALSIIRGRVFLSDGVVNAPISNINLILYDQNNVAIQSILSTTNFTVNYTFASVPPGTYTIRTPAKTAEGYILIDSPATFVLGAATFYGPDIRYKRPIPTSIFPLDCYHIINKATNKVLEVKDASQVDGAQIYGWTETNNRLQQIWQFWNLTSDSIYNIVNRNSSKFIDVMDNTPSGNCIEGTLTQQFTADGTGSQKWVLQLQADGSYKIRNLTCNKNLCVETASIVDGAKVSMKTDLGTDAFKWLLKKVNCSTGIALAATNATFGFEARASEGRAKLQWITNTGYKNDYFEIERLNANGSFDILGRQNAYAGDDMKSYTFTDNDPLDGNNFYRINSISNSNTPPLQGSPLGQYSEVKKVTFSKNDGISIFPNPADEFINVDLRKYEGKTVALSVYNSVGLLVKKQTIEKVSAAPQQIDVQGFGAGSYLLRVQSEGKREVTRLFHIAK